RSLKLEPKELSSFPESDSREARQDLVADEGQLGDVVHKRKGDATHPGAAQIGKFIGYLVGRANERITADRISREIETLGRVFLLAKGVAGDVAERHHAFDRSPIGVVDESVPVVIVGLLLCAAADDVTDRVDLDVALIAARLAFFFF